MIERLARIPYGQVFSLARALKHLIPDAKPVNGAVRPAVPLIVSWAKAYRTYIVGMRGLLEFSNPIFLNQAKHVVHISYVIAFEIFNVVKKNLLVKIRIPSD